MDSKQDLSTLIENRDDFDSYFQCITACYGLAGEDMECVTQCIELHLEEDASL